MPSECSVAVVPNELTQIVESVFGTMMGLQPIEHQMPWFPGDDRVTAAIQLAGDWNGAVLIECSRGQACRFAGRFLSMDPPDEVDDVVRDVLGELANIVGGNLKCVLTRGIRLSMPTVVNGCDYHVRVCGAEVADRLAFHCDEGPFWVTVLTTRS